MRYSNCPKDQVFIKGYGFLYFGKSLGKSISKNSKCKYNPKFLDSD